MSVEVKTMSAAFAVLLLLAIESARIPPDPGLYYLQGAELTRMEARAVTVSEAGGRLPKMPMKGRLPMVGGNKASGELLGEHAAQRVTAIPVFYYRVAPGSEATGAADLVLVKLKARHRRRDFTVSSAGDWKSSSGVPLRAQVQFLSRQVESGVYQLTPAEDLEEGEYGFYLFRGHDLPGLIYDFSVE